MVMGSPLAWNSWKYQHRNTKAEIEKVEIPNKKYQSRNVTAEIQRQYESGLAKKTVRKSQIFPEE